MLLLTEQRIGGEDLRDDPVQIVKEGRPLPQDAAAIPDEDDQGSLSRDHDLVVVTPALPPYLILTKLLTYYSKRLLV